MLFVCIFKELLESISVEHTIIVHISNKLLIYSCSPAHHVTGSREMVLFVVHILLLLFHLLSWRGFTYIHIHESQRIRFCFLITRMKDFINIILVTHID